jgi:hypothetical protein
MLTWLGLLAGATHVYAQTAETAFHGGAQVYVDGRLQEAEEVVADGLASHPGDPKLLALKALIDEEKERRQQSGEGTSQEQQQEENREQQPQPNQSGQEEQSEQQESGEGQQQDQQEGQSEQQPEDPDEQRQAEEREQQSVEAGQDPDQLSRAQAVRILQALQNEEEQLLREVQKIKGRPRRVEKDW